MTPQTELPTYEEAATCPKCGKPGDVRLVSIPPANARLKPGTKIHHAYCTTELCRWYNTAWQITVNPDGSVPAPKNHTGEKKIYVGFENHDAEAKRIIESIDRAARSELK